MIRYLLLIFSLASPLFSDTLSLSKAVQIGLENNFSIRISRINQQKSGNNMRLKTGVLLPSLQLDAAGGRTSSDYRSSPAAQTQSDELRAGVSAHWTLFDGFRMFRTADQIDHSVDLSTLATRYQIETAAATIITSYYNLIAQRSLCAAAREQLALSKRHLSFTSTQFEYGQVGSREQLAQQVSVNTDSSALLSLLLAEITALHTVNIALGQTPDLPLETITDTTITAPVETASWWYQEALSHNAGLKMKMVQHKLSITRHALATSALWPVVTATGSLHGINQNNLEFTQSQIGLSLTLPLFSGFTTTTTIKNSILDTSAAEITVKEAKADLQAAVYEQFERLRMSEIQCRFETEAITRARESLQLSEEQFRLGRISNITLREAQISLLNAQVRYQSALFQNRIIAVQLELLAGKLSLK